MLTENSILQEYAERKAKIKQRQSDFEGIWSRGTEKELFAELCFCLLTPQSSAIACDAAVKRLLENNTLFSGTKKELQKKIFPVRFYKNKSSYVLEAREKFLSGNESSIKAMLEQANILNNNFEAREWLVKSVKGFGYKEASHFLRNIGFGEGICILDRHILKNLAKHKVIQEIPKTLSRKKYLEIEQKMKIFSQKLGIPEHEMDLLFWSRQTGVVFK